VTKVLKREIGLSQGVVRYEVLRAAEKVRRVSVSSTDSLDHSRCAKRRSEAQRRFPAPITY